MGDRGIGVGHRVAECDVGLDASYANRAVHRPLRYQRNVFFPSAFG
jgi:hypothetical protein